jgi:hypothetical protein
LSAIEAGIAGDPKAVIVAAMLPHVPNPAQALQQAVGREDG